MLSVDGRGSRSSSARRQTLTVRDEVASPTAVARLAWLDVLDREGKGVRLPEDVLNGLEQATDRHLLLVLHGAVDHPEVSAPLPQPVMRDGLDPLVTRQEDASFLGSVREELRIVILLPEEVHCTGHVPALLTQGLDQWAADLVVRKERKAGHYRLERLLE